MSDSLAGSATKYALVALVPTIMVASILCAISPVIALEFGAAIAMVVMLALTRSLAITAILLSGTVDLFTNVRAGSVSGLGALTIGYTAAAWLFWMTNSTQSARIYGRVVPFCMLVGLGVLSFAWYKPTIPGVQSLLAVAAFIGLLLLTASSTANDPTFPSKVGRALGIASVVAVCTYILRLLFEGGAMQGAGPRTFSLFALVVIAWYVAGWTAYSKRDFWPAIVMLAVVAVSLSRTALFVGTALIPAARLRLQSLGGWVRLIVWSGLAIAVLFAAVSFVGPLRQRFFTGDTSLQVFGLHINTEGRLDLWKLTIDSYRQSPVLGRGVGSSQVVINAVYPGLDHPHNDYLRLLHDFGPAGLLCWLIGYAALFIESWRAWTRSQAERPADARVHLAALLALIAVALSMVTDNPTTYIFVMAPLGVIVGASVGLSAQAKPVQSPAVQRFTMLGNAAQPRYLPKHAHVIPNGLEQPTRVSSKT